MLLCDKLVFVLPWWLSCLDRGAVINVDAPGCGKSVVHVRWRPDRAQVGRFTLCTQRFPRRKCLLLVPYTSLYRILIKEPSSYKSESALHQRGPLGRTVLKH